MSTITSIQRSAWSGLEALAARTERTGSTGSAAKSADEMFAAADSDGDGTLTRAEFDAALKAAQPQSFDLSGQSTQAFAGARCKGMPPPPQGEGGKDPIAALDSDGDGSVSAAEFGLDGASASVKQLFAAIDGDGDGALSTAETDAFREKFTQATGGAHPPPPGPPPGAGSEGVAAQAASGSTGASATASATADDELRGFLQQLSELFVKRYADIAAAGSTAEQAVSLSA